MPVSCPYPTREPAGQQFLSRQPPAAHHSSRHVLRSTCPPVGRCAELLKESLDQERGLIFMAYNANLAEQFEAVQRWLNGANSSASYSGQSDPVFGVAESGRRRFFRFEHDEQTVRVAVDGSDRLHDEPRPFVRLEWGAYLFAPSRKALASLQQRAAAQGNKRPVIWSVDEGEKEIARLRETETRGRRRRSWPGRLRSKIPMRRRTSRPHRSGPPSASVTAAC